jgi:hypothetical protein
VVEAPRGTPGNWVAASADRSDSDLMDLSDAAQTWRENGFVILPGFIPRDELEPAACELELQFPSTEGFHDGTDPRRERFIGDQFAGIDYFPFASTEINLLAVHHRS